MKDEKIQVKTIQSENEVDRLEIGGMRSGSGSGSGSDGGGSSSGGGGSDSCIIISYNLDVPPINKELQLNNCTITASATITGTAEKRIYRDGAITNDINMNVDFRITGGVTQKWMKDSFDNDVLVTYTVEGGRDSKRIISTSLDHFDGANGCIDCDYYDDYDHVVPNTCNYNLDVSFYLSSSPTPHIEDISFNV